jgi:2-hydroxychromene-2-carboxylate isomerase
VSALGARAGHNVEPTPVLLAGILDRLGTKGPAEVPARRSYVFKDLLRAADRAGVRIVPPRAHPFNPLLALRIAGLPVEAPMRRRIIDALFNATWAEGGGIDDAKSITDVLGRAGIDATPLLSQAAQPEAKDRLRHQTEHALARGAFGVPTLFVDGEMFFGFDSFRDIEAHLRGEDPAVKHHDLVARWLALPPAAVRPASTR